MKTNFATRAANCNLFFRAFSAWFQAAVCEISARSVQRLSHSGPTLRRQVPEIENGRFLGQFSTDPGDIKCSVFRMKPASRVPSFRFFPALSVPGSRLLFPGPPLAEVHAPPPCGQDVGTEKGLFLGQFLMDSGESKCSGFRMVPASCIKNCIFFPALSVPGSNFLDEWLTAKIPRADCSATSGRIPAISSVLSSRRRQLGPQKIAGP